MLVAGRRPVRDQPGRPAARARPRSRAGGSATTAPAARRPGPGWSRAPSPARSAGAVAAGAALRRSRVADRAERVRPGRDLGHVVTVRLPDRTGSTWCDWPVACRSRGSEGRPGGRRHEHGAERDVARGLDALRAAVAGGARRARARARRRCRRRAADAGRRPRRSGLAPHRGQPRPGVASGRPAPAAYDDADLAASSEEDEAERHPADRARRAGPQRRHRRVRAALRPLPARRSTASSTTGPARSTLAEDLTSETFFRALRSMNNFRWQGKDFGAWLMTIARNLTTDHFKAGRTRLEHDHRGHGRRTTTPPRARRPRCSPALTNEVLLEALTELPDRAARLPDDAVPAGHEHRRDRRTSSAAATARSSSSSCAAYATSRSCCPRGSGTDDALTSPGPP